MKHLITLTYAVEASSTKEAMRKIVKFQTSLDFKLVQEMNPEPEVILKSVTDLPFRERKLIEIMNQEIIDFQVAHHGCLTSGDLQTLAKFAKDHHKSITEKMSCG